MSHTEKHRIRHSCKNWITYQFAIAILFVSVWPGMTRAEDESTASAPDAEQQTAPPTNTFPATDKEYKSGKISATLAVSTGGGWQLAPELTRLPYNLMVAPGIALGTADDLLGMLRLELGLGLNGLRSGPGPTAELWPMLVLGPDPNLGFYIRVITADLLLLAKDQTTFGMTVGIEMHVGENGIFLEGGTLGRGLGADEHSETDVAWIVEGRIGVIHAF